jgi:hypothetical protein
MPYKKTHPGLDEVLTDEALRAFMEPPTVDGVPERRWPVFVLIAVAANTIGLIVGKTIAPTVSWAQLALLVVAVASGAAAFGWHEHQLREGDHT